MPCSIQTKRTLYLNVYWNILQLLFTSRRVGIFRRCSYQWPPTRFRQVAGKRQGALPATTDLNRRIRVIVHQDPHQGFFTHLTVQIATSARHSRLEIVWSALFKSTRENRFWLNNFRNDLEAATASLNSAAVRSLPLIMNSTEPL